MSEQNEMEKIVNPFTGEATMVEASSLNDRTDCGLIFTVKGITVDDGEFDVVVYTTKSYTNNANATKVAYTLTEDDDSNILENYVHTMQFSKGNCGPNELTFFKKYMPTWETGTPTHIHFSDCVLEVVKFVGIGYTGGYTDIILHSTGITLYTNRELEYHKKKDGSYLYGYSLSKGISFSDKEEVIDVKKVIE